MRRRINLALAVVVALGATVAGQQVRDEPVKLPAGTAVVSGVVLIGETGATPARRARVTLNTTNPLGGHSTIADDDGRFVLAGVQADSFTLSARKDGFITTMFGARRPGGPGVTLVVSAGAQIDGLTIRVYRGAAIGGRVLDVRGDPVSGARIQAWRVRTIGGERRLETSGQNAFSDDRGNYRMHTLLAGEYLIAATVRAPGGEAGVRQVTDREIQAVLQRLNAPIAGPPAPAAPPAPADAIFAPVYFPSALTPDDATAVKVGTGEERTGIDFIVQPVRAARVEGVVVDPAGRLAVTAQVSLISTNAVGISATRSVSTRLSAGGAFAFAGVMPGAYVLRVQVRQPAPPPSPGATFVPSPAVYWGQADVTVTGSDVTGIALELQPALAISGRVTLQRTTPAERGDDLSRVRVHLQTLPATGGGQVLSNVTTNVAADGTFTFPLVVPGRYRVAASYAGPATAPGAPPSSATWIVTSALIGDRDASDAPVDVGPGGALDRVAITLTDRGGGIAGTLRDAAGKPASDCYIVVFPAEPRFWVRGSRRLFSLRPASDGAYSAGNLPPGDYIVAAVTDMEASDLFDAAFLGPLVSAGVNVTVGAGEARVQNLRIGG